MSQVVPPRLVLALCAFAAGCNAGGATPTADGGIFVAYASDFRNFHDWPSASAVPAPTLPAIDGGDGVDAGAPTDGGVHKLPLTVYWHWMQPPHGSTSFPLRTLIVKETSEADPTARKVFAMAKRGGDFNDPGAVNWEWFELQNAADGSVTINWRGVGPGSGSTDFYAGDPQICNNCHGIALANDYVWSS